MEFPFHINQLFPERVTVLDHTLVAGKSAVRPDLQGNIATVIDELGKASAKAQQLTAAITSGSKLQTQKHQLYLLTDGEGNGGKGVAVGFLKVGYKKLFLLDRHGVHIEAEPLCVLDFYIAESFQRHGYGMELFDFMLQHKNVEPVVMAYDRPSTKFLSFLEKRYCLSESVPQVNNFVVFEGFFLNRSAAQMRKVPLRKTDAEMKTYSSMDREVVGQEQRVQSPRRLVSSQCCPSPPSRMPPPEAHHQPQHSPPQAPCIQRCRANRSSFCGSQQGLVARCSLYSRHMDSRAGGLLDIHLKGLRPVEDQSYAPGCTDTHRSANIHTLQPRSPPPSLQPLSASKNDDISGQTNGGIISGQTSLNRDPETQLDRAAAEEDIGLLDSPQSVAAPGMLLTHRHGAGRPGWWWTVGHNFSTAQGVKLRQGYRSTRPW